ncbi:hypothetical protein WDZ92_15555, partial [Nostoc sp. NIES-2111]
TNKLSNLRFSALGFGFALFRLFATSYKNMLKFAWADDGRHRVIYPLSLVLFGVLIYKLAPS